MAVDSREKGKRGEYQVRDILRERTGLEWERVPGSGAFGQSHGLKGDIYLPPQSGHISKYCFEVKWYKDDNISSNLFNVGESTLEKWWQQCAREGEQMNSKPALIFKKDRGQWLVALDSSDPMVDNLMSRTHMVLNKKDMEIVIGLFEPWLHHLSVEDLIK
ncbi:hypothetical protein MT068_001503 [Salmonella enterica]|nr:hypothetical protein [Salmonella enterica]